MEVLLERSQRQRGVDYCPLCGIVRGERSDEVVVYEDNKVIVVESSRPIAPVHLIVFPKAHYVDMAELAISDALPAMLSVVRSFIDRYGIVDKRLGIYCGTCPAHPHLHLQLLCGQVLSVVADDLGTPG